MIHHTVAVVLRVTVLQRAYGVDARLLIIEPVVLGDPAALDHAQGDHAGEVGGLAAVVVVGALGAVGAGGALPLALGHDEAAAQASPQVLLLCRVRRILTCLLQALEAVHVAASPLLFVLILAGSVRVAAVTTIIPIIVTHFLFFIIK